MDVLKPLMALLLCVYFSACSANKRISDVMEDEGGQTPNSKPCAGQKIENRYIVLWEDGRIEAYTWSSYEDFKREFVEPNLEQIKRVEFDRLVQLSEPITPSFGSSSKSQDWGQRVIEAESLWQQGHTGENIVVGIIDTWVDPTHPQLANQFYINQGEIPDNFIDDDNNGFVDDYYGYQFYQVPETPHMSPVQVKHGSHVAGLIVADHSKGAVKGIAPGAKIVSAPFLNRDGYGSIHDAIRAFDYLKMRGVKIINASWGGSGCSSALQSKIESLANEDILVVVAAGNNGHDVGIYNEFPSSFNSFNQITVAASTDFDLMAGWSNFSTRLVHLAAPGERIFSTVPFSLEPAGAAYMSGTSMAAPIVSGAAAVLWGLRPQAHFSEIKAALLSSVDTAYGFSVSTGGRLNLRRAAEQLQERVP